MIDLDALDAGLARLDPRNWMLDVPGWGMLRVKHLRTLVEVARGAHDLVERNGGGPAELLSALAALDMREKTS